MNLSVTPLLLHSDQVPAAVRAELRAAYEGPETERTRHLEIAAGILHREVPLDCLDARELVGLDASACL